MFDKLLEEDERVIALMAEREARGRIEGEARGRIEGEARGRIEGEARGEVRGEVRGKAELLTTVIETRFPALAEEAHRKLLRVKRPEEFDKLAKLVVTAPDEKTLRWVLDSLVA